MASLVLSVKDDRPALLLCQCEQVLFVRFTTIPPRLTDQCNFFTVLLVTRGTGADDASYLF